MKKDVKRGYDSAVRREQAALTRGKVLDAAFELFRAQGYARTTIKSIAERAGVAPDTIYAIFGQKPRILTALIDRALGGDSVANVLDRPEVLAIRDEPDQRRQIELWARTMRGLLRNVRPLVAIMSGAAAADAELAAVRVEMEGYRARNTRRLAEWIAARGPLRMPVEDAADVLWAVGSPDLANLLIDVRGWSEDRHESWVADTLTRTLLPDAPPRRRGRA